MATAASSLPLPRALPAAKGDPLPGVPPLETGDRLGQREFHRRYERMPWVKKAELVEGVVFMASPVRVSHHGRPHVFFTTWLGVYLSQHLELICADNSTVILDPDNEYQPDLFLALPAERGGQSKLNEAGYLEGAPEFVCEIAASSVSLDLHAKLNVYRRTGVKEYVVWRVLDQEIDCFENVDGEFHRAARTEQGLWTSKIFSGLALDIPAAMRGDLPAVLAALNPPR